MYNLKIFSILLLASVAYGNIIKWGDRTAKKEVVTIVKNMVLDIAVDSETGAVLFNEVVPGHEELFKLNVYLPGKAGYKQIEEGYKGYPQGVTIDEKRNVVYFSTTEGIYKIPKDTKKVDFFGQDGKDIINVQYKNDALYFVTAQYKPSKYVWINGEPKVEDINIPYADGLVVDSEGNIFYEDKDKKTRKLPHGQTESIAITGLDGLDITATAFDRNDNFYLTAGKDSYFVKKGETEAKQLPSVAKDIVTAAFVDKNQVSYIAEGNTIYKYTEIK